MAEPEFPSDTFEKFPEDFFSMRAKDIDGNEIDFKTFQGKKAYIICNVASECGLTDSGYKGLRNLYDKYKEQGLEILAFPCNQFGAQEPKCGIDIKNFATSNYGANFPMFEKIEVNGQNTHDLYKYLRGHSSHRVKGTNEVTAIAWNFAHFLLDKEGKIVQAFAPEEKDEVIEEELKKLL